MELEHRFRHTDGTHILTPSHTGADPGVLEVYTTRIKKNSLFAQTCVWTQNIDKIYRLHMPEIAPFDVYYFVFWGRITLPLHPSSAHVFYKMPNPAALF